MTVHVEVAGRTVRLTTLDRVLFPGPGSGFRKRDVLDYYATVAPLLLPHLVGRPVTLHRFPEGVGGPSFYQTRCPPHPEWLRTQRMWVFRSGKDVEAPVIDDLAGLVWAVNLSTLEFHPYLACAEDLATPLAVVFDLDPGPPAGLLDAAALALELRQLLDDLGLVSAAKTSGGAGMHVYVPVNGPVGYPETKAFAHAVAGILVHRHPDRVVDVMTRSVRAGKVFVDWSQNDAGKSTVVAYSLRGYELPWVSTPVGWDEVAGAVDAGSEDGLRFLPGDVLARVERHGDLFSDVLRVRQSLPAPGIM